MYAPDDTEGIDFRDEPNIGIAIFSLGDVANPVCKFWTEFRNS